MCQDLRVQRLTDREFRDWCRLLELSAYHETDGRFNAVDAKLEGVKPASITTFVSNGLVERNGVGYVITAWPKYQRTKAQLQSEREAARQRAAERRANA